MFVILGNFNFPKSTSAENKSVSLVPDNRFENCQLVICLCCPVRVDIDLLATSDYCLVAILLF